MKEKVIFALILIIAVLSASVAIQHNRIEKIKQQRDTELRNKEVLLQDAVSRYKTADSLNAVSIRELSLRRDELQKYRTSTAKIIKGLEIDKKGLESITAMQMQTIRQLRGAMAETVADTVYLPGTQMRVIEYVDKWLDLAVRLYADDTADIDMTSRESLIYTEWIKRRRFLWFRFGTKERRQEIVSLNPNTEIQNAEFITVRD